MVVGAVERERAAVEPAAQVAPDTAPVRPLPEASPADVPELSSNPYAATRPCAAAQPAVEPVTSARGDGVPDVSNASTSNSYPVEHESPFTVNAVDVVVPTETSPA